MHTIGKNDIPNVVELPRRTTQCSIRPTTHRSRIERRVVFLSFMFIVLALELFCLGGCSNPDGSGWDALVASVGDGISSFLTHMTEVLLLNFIL
jgi:hypothetical protein